MRGNHDRIFARKPVRSGLPGEPCRRHRAGIRRRLSEPPGALADRLCRRRPGRHRGAHHGQALSEHFGQQFVVENRAGSGGNIATAAAIDSTPDGYTLLFSGANNAICASLYKKLPFDFIRDTVPVALFTQVPNLLVVSNAMPVKIGAGADRLLQGQSRQDLLCLVGQRHHACTWRRNCSRR